MTKVRAYLRPILVVIAGLLLGWFALAITMDRVLAESAPAIALFWNPGSADANTAYADHVLQDHPLKAAVAIVRDHAARALNRQPIDAAAARQLALVAAVAGQERRTRGLLAYADAMSRRDLQTQLLLIQTNVARADVDAALLHYDRAMRTSPSSWPTLFPVLAHAAEAPAIWRPLSFFLARRPPWERPFLEQLVPQSRAPEALYGFARMLRLDRQSSPDPAMLQGIEKRLVDLGAYRMALTLYNRAHGIPLQDDALLRNGGFDRPGGWDPFDWNLIDEPDFAARIQPNPVTTAGQALFLIAANGRGGDLAVQVLLLSPGGYRLGARVGGIRGDQLAHPQIVVRCAGDRRELLHTSFPSAPAEGRSWQTDFVVPPDCPAQRLVLQARSPLDAQDDAPWIDDIVVRRQETR